MRKKEITELKNCPWKLWNIRITILRLGSRNLDIKNTRHRGGRFLRVFPSKSYYAFCLSNPGYMPSPSWTPRFYCYNKLGVSQDVSFYMAYPFGNWVQGCRPKLSMEQGLFWICHDHNFLPHYGPWMLITESTRAREWTLSWDGDNPHYIFQQYFYKTHFDIILSPKPCFPNFCLPSNFEINIFLRIFHVFHMCCMFLPSSLNWSESQYLLQNILLHFLVFN